MGKHFHTLVGCPVIAGFAAGYAIVETILAKADVNLALASAAVALAHALLFGHITLHTKVLLLGSGSSAHGKTLCLKPGLA